MNKDDDIKKLTDLRQRFKNLYKKKISDIGTEIIIKVCEDYLDYPDKYSNPTPGIQGYMLPSVGNCAQAVSELIKKSELEYLSSHEIECINLIGIIRLLDKKISLVKEKSLKCRKSNY